MNQLLDNILKIDERIQSDKFVFIKLNVENLDTSSAHYQEMVRQTDLLIRVLDAFSQPLKGIKIHGKTS